MKKNGNKLSPFIVYYYLYIIFDINFVNKSWPTMAELSITLADVSMTFGRTVMAEVSTEHGRCVIWPNRLSTGATISPSANKANWKSIPKSLDDDESEQ